MPNLPSGTVTFMFTDIEGSTRLWERDRAAMAVAVERHLQVLRESVERQNGVLFKTVGDAVQAAFPTAPDAIAAAVAGQRSLVTEGRIEAYGPLKVRMALHTVAAKPRNGDYLAPGLNRLARLLGAGHGGQVLLTHAAQELTWDSLPAGASLHDLGDHRLRDLLEPERVFQLLHPELPGDFPPLKTLENRPNNLPLQPTPFMARVREVDQAGALLRRDDVRLLTLTGPGGVGKTRLALQVAAELLDDFPDGVFFVTLAPLSDPGLVPAAIADVLSVRAEPGRTLVAALAAFLAGKRVLLVLDNFEHVAEAAPVVAEFLGAAGDLKVLATSRAPLRLRAEREFPVDPLALPGRKPPPTMEQLSQFDAVRLFIERAQAVKPDFAVDNENAPAIAEICWRLDGLPLAIELAAARVKLLPPVALLKRLERLLPLLMGGPRDLPARQQTLRNTIAWSHDLLSPGEQALFRRLAVFAGGCTFEAAEAVADPAGELDLFEGLASLVDENLVRQAPGSGGDPRYLMLETIREFAWERLSASSEAESVRDSHAAWCLALSERWPADERYRLEAERTELLESEHDNLRAALAWFEGQQDWSRGLRLAAAMGTFWFARAHLTEGRGWLERLLAHREELPGTIVTEALRWAALLSLFLGDLPAAATFLADALAEGSEAGEDRGLCWTEHFLGLLAEFSGDEIAAAAHYEESLLLARGIGDLGAASVSLNNLADAAYRRGDFERAAALSAEATAIARRGDLTFFLVLSLTTQGYTALARGETGESVRLFREGLARMGRFDNPFFTADAIAGLASGALAAGQPERATRLLGAVAAICERTGLTFLGHDAQQQHTTSLLCEQLPGDVFAAAWDIGRALAPQEAIAEARALADELTTAVGASR